MTTTVEYEVLNAAVDDWESLDQIFLSVRFEFQSDKGNRSTQAGSCWRDRNPAITLAEIAESIAKLVTSGQLLARREDGSRTTTICGDDVFNCWFHTSDSGRSVLREAELA